MKEVQKKRNRKEAIHEIKFSPDGKYLAVGSHDNFVDIYSTEDYKLLGTCKGSSSYITHVDWTKDSAFLQTNSGAHEHLLYEAPSGKHITDRKLVEKLHRFADWQTWTGVLGDLVDGVWPKGSDITDVNSLCVMKNGTTLATGDDFGFVKLFEFPCKTRGVRFISDCIGD
jgi:WD40 repeat protein